jgi:hypothetical protein
MNNRDQFKRKLIEAAQFEPMDERVPAGLVQNVMTRISGLEIEERSERGLSVKGVFFGSLLSFLLGCLVLGVSCLEAVNQLQVEQSKNPFYPHRKVGFYQLRLSSRALAVNPRLRIIRSGKENNSFLQREFVVFLRSLEG